MEENKHKESLVRETVSKRLIDAQKSKEFKDTDIVSYTKKYKRSFDVVRANDLDELELDSVMAYKQVEKSKVWAEYNLQEQKEKGYGSGATYLKVKCREALQTRPFDSKDARDIYVKNVEKVITILDACYTADDVIKQLYNFIYDKNFYTGAEIKSIDDTFVGIISFTWNRTSPTNKKLETIFGKRFFNFCKRQSDSVLQDIALAKLYDAYTEEQQDAYIASQIGTNTHNLKIANENLDAAIILSNDEFRLEQQIRSKYSHLIKNKVKDFSSYFQQNIGEYKDIYLSSFKGRVNLYTNNIEILNKRENLQPQYIIRDANWDWAFGEKEKVERKKSENVQINTKLPLDHINRVGGLEIPTISVESITKEFCFNNVVFGNSLKDIEGKEHVKHFLGALTDLAEILDLDICAVNQLGKLDINFATMGTKGHMATYFPSYKAINLTKKNGDGSVAHEWFHYLDNVVQEGAERIGSYKLASEWAKSTDGGTKQIMYQLLNYIRKGDGTPKAIVYTFLAQDKVKYHAYGDTLEESISAIQRMYPAYAKVSRAKEKSIENYYGFLASKFGKEYIEVPMKLDTTYFYYASAKMGTKYWVEPAELFARAFEAYIEYILDLKDRKSNYLVSYKNNYIHHESPYPKDDELEKITHYFDSMIREFKKEFNIGEFKPFTDKRTSEYVELDNTKKEKKETIKEQSKTNDMPTMIREPQKTEDKKQIDVQMQAAEIIAHKTGLDVVRVYEWGKDNNIDLAMNGHILSDINNNAEVVGDIVNDKYEFIKELIEGEKISEKIEVETHIHISDKVDTAIKEISNKYGIDSEHGQFIYDIFNENRNKVLEADEDKQPVHDLLYTDLLLDSTEESWKGEYILSNLGGEFLDAINARIQTMIDVELGMDLFPENANIVEPVAPIKAEKCTQHINDFKAKYSKPIFEVGMSGITAYRISLSITTITSEEIIFDAKKGSRNEAAVEIYTYDELSEMFANGDLTVKEYDNETDKHVFEKMLYAVQICATVDYHTDVVAKRENVLKYTVQELEEKTKEAERLQAELESFKEKEAKDRIDAINNEHESRKVIVSERQAKDLIKKETESKASKLESLDLYLELLNEMKDATKGKNKKSELADLIELVSEMMDELK